MVTKDMDKGFEEEYWAFERKVRHGYDFVRLRPIYSKYIKWIKRILAEHGTITSNREISILDIGCGFGYFLKLCEEEGWRTYGVDISKYAIEKARSNTNAELFVHNVEEGLSMFDDNFFDIVSMIEVIEHLKSPFKVLREIHRVLKLNGLLVITTPNLNALGRFLLKMVRKERQWYGFLDETHIYLFTPLSLKFLVERAGFKIIELRTPFHFLPEFFQPVVSRSGLGGQIWLVAKK